MRRKGRGKRGKIYGEGNRLLLQRRKIVKEKEENFEEEKHCLWGKRRTE